MMRDSCETPPAATPADRVSLTKLAGISFRRYLVSSVLVRTGPRPTKPTSFSPRVVPDVIPSACPTVTPPLCPPGQAEAGSGCVRDEEQTELEFVRAEGCDEGFSGEVRRGRQRAEAASGRETPPPVLPSIDPSRRLLACLLALIHCSDSSCSRPRRRIRGSADPVPRPRRHATS